MLPLTFEDRLKDISIPERVCWVIYVEDCFNLNVSQTIKTLPLSIVYMTSFNTNLVSAVPTFIVTAHPISKFIHNYENKYFCT